MQIIAFIQARMGSSRLPGKVLMPLMGQPMIQWQLDRLKKSKHITRVALLTSDQPSDDVLAQYGAAKGISVYRGSENNVLGRFYDASLKFLPSEERDASIVIRLTGDCPLIDPTMIDEALTQFEALRPQGCRYFGYDTDLPDGMDFEIFTWGALRESFENAKDPFEQEHVTPFMWRNPDRFKVARYKKAGIKPGLRFSVDHIEDIQLVAELIRHQNEIGTFMGAVEISQYLDQHPELTEINSKIVKNEGLIKSAIVSKSLKVQIGVALPSGAPLDSELIRWSSKMGINAWLAASSQKKDLTTQLAENVEVMEVVPEGWEVVTENEGWEQALLKAADHPDNRGVFIETATRDQLVRMLTLLCHTRFTL